MQKSIEQLSWTELEARVAQCTLCELHKSRTRTVFGSGNLHAEVFLVGEAPGANEDKQGLPFVGQAGKLLNQLLDAIGLQREQVYITNLVKSRPPLNRPPRVEEIASCFPYLQRQIVLVKPKLLIALGRLAAHYLLDTKQSLEKLRQQIHTYGETRIPLIATYHPAFLLRYPLNKAKALEDWRFIQGVLRDK